MVTTEGFTIDSPEYYRIACNAYYQTKEGFSIHHKPSALVAIVFSALALEGFINEIGELVKLAKDSGCTDNFLDDAVNATSEETENKKTQEKFLLASESFCPSLPLKKGEQPYQDFTLLFTLRDALVHLKPSKFSIEEDNSWIWEPKEIIQRLQDRKILEEDFIVTESLYIMVGTSRTAKWACNTAAIMVNAILEKIPDSQFKEDSTIYLQQYREAFQTIDDREKDCLEKERKKRTDDVNKAAEIRQRLLEIHGEFPDAVEFVREDRER